MVQWKFLIQKEGDQDWLPLESPNVEILEGRYCLLGQADCPSVQVEIQIRHEYEVDNIPQVAIQQRRQQTNTQGQLDLFALAYLPPGLWEIKVQLEPLHRDTENALPQKLVLQVLAQDFELLSDWAHPDTSFEKALPGEFAADSLGHRHRTAVPVVQLPTLPKDASPVRLRLSDTFCLPPMIYSPQKDGGTTVRPQLPTFVLGSPPIPMASTPGGQPLPRLRRIAKVADREAVYKAFEPLARRQRFLRTLRTLAQTSLSSETVEFKS